MRNHFTTPSVSIPLFFLLLPSFSTLLLPQTILISAEATSSWSNSIITDTCIHSRTTTTAAHNTSLKKRIQKVPVRIPSAFILKMSNSNKNSNKKKCKEIYNIPGSRWSSPTWNWGYANGTGHDCALICRRKYSTEQARQELIQSLLLHGENGDGNDGDESKITNDNNTSLPSPPFEEVKLILGLTMQRGKWDGTDGGRNGGYGEILEYMAQAKRYESSNEEMHSKLFVKDMSDRFHLIVGNMFSDENDVDINDSMDMMKQIHKNYGHDYDIMRKKCAGLVLQKMGFIELGM